MRKTLKSGAGKLNLCLIALLLTTACLFMSQLAFAAINPATVQDGSTLKTAESDENSVQATYDVYSDVIRRTQIYSATGDDNVLTWEIPAGTYYVEISDSAFILKSK